MIKDEDLCHLKIKYKERKPNELRVISFVYKRKLDREVDDLKKVKKHERNEVR